MLSFSVLLHAAALGVVLANPHVDEAVTVTVTRTHVICPITTPVTCLDTPDAGSSPANGNSNGWGSKEGLATVTGQDQSVADVYASLWDNAKTQYNGQWDDWNNSPPPTSSATSLEASTSTASTRPVTTAYTSGYSNRTTTSTGVVLSSTVTSSSASSSPSLIQNATDVCNDNLHRSKWCGGKTINDNYYQNDYSTGVTRKYVFTITNTTLVFDGTGPKLALAINGQVPGPVIEANWGDDVEVTFINNLQDNSTSIHFHGIRQEGTNDQDGVPGVTQCPIAGNGGSRTYRWRASSYGTSWYHSHLFAQLGDGIRGPIVIHGPASANYDYDMGTVMLDDTFTIPAAAQAARIAHVGPGGSFNTLFNGKNKNPDGQAGQSFEWAVKPGKKHLFRLINSASQNSYIIGFDRHTITVIAADFVPIKPYKTTTLKIANGQRYDVILEADQPIDRYFLRAVIQTACPSGGANSGLGLANAIISYEGANQTSPVSQTTITNVTAAICEDEPLASLVPWYSMSAGNVDDFKASVSTIPGGAVNQVATNDDGSVFKWFLNNAAMSVNFTQPTLQTLASGLGANSTQISNQVILSKKNEWAYFVIQNQFFAAHPMHVHGHDVSVLGTGTGTFSTDQASSLNFANPIRRDTVMLTGAPGPGSPSGWTVIGFRTDNPGAWLMHCHIAWHVDGGLSLQFVERPDDIPAKQYVNQRFQDECSALKAYQASKPISVKLSGQSGLKKRGPNALNLERSPVESHKHTFQYHKRHSGHHH